MSHVIYLNSAIIYDLRIVINTLPPSIVSVDVNSGAIDLLSIHLSRLSIIVRQGVLSTLLTR